MVKDKNEEVIKEIVGDTLRRLKEVKDKNILYSFIAKLNKTANLTQYRLGDCKYKVIKLDEYEKIRNDQLRRTECHPEIMAELFLTMPLVSKVRFLNKISNIIFSEPNNLINEMDDIVKHKKINANTKSMFREIVYRISVNDKDNAKNNK